MPNKSDLEKIRKSRCFPSLLSAEAGLYIYIYIYNLQHFCPVNDSYPVVHLLDTRGAQAISNLQL